MYREIKMEVKKIVVAIGFLIAGGAYAQTNVQVYGIIDAGVVSSSDRASAGHTLGLDGGNQSGSRFGLRGTEDLGGGLSARFNVENGFATDTGAATQGGLLFGRQARVGLQGGFGAVDLGRQNTVTFNAHIVLDPFGTGFGGASTNMFAANGLRMDNSIKYTAPTIGGFSGEVMYGFGEVAGNTSANRQIGLGLWYNNGPVVVRFAHNNANNVADTNTTKNTLLGGVYNFGILKLHAAYAVNKDNATLDTRDLMVGVTVPFGASNVMASYIRKDDRRNANSDANQMSIAYTYNLSKRTNLYAAYSHMDNDSAVKYNAAANGFDSSILQLGVRHMF
jgi:predicted porin